MKKIILLVIVTVVMSCDKKKDAMIKIRDTDKIQIVLLGIENTPKDKQLDSKLYISNKEVLKKVDLTKKQMTLFRKEFLKEKNYGKYNRKCRYDPAYALLINEELYATFDLKYCPGIKYYLESDEIVFKEITVNSTLVDVVNNVITE